MSCNPVTSTTPPGWALTTLGEMVEFSYGKGLREDRRDASGSVPVYGSNGVVGMHSVALVDQPCIVVGRKGSAGEVHIARVPSWPIDTTYYILPPHGLHLEFINYLLKTLSLGSLDRSSAIPGLNRDDAYAATVPLPPFPEQRRIVAKIEELFSQLDAGVEELKKAKAQLKRYRQSVLKAAFEGKLTEEWRKKNLTTKTPRHKEGKKPETAQELLNRIREERKKALGTKYKEPPPLDTSELPELPEGWAYARLPDLGELNRGKSKHRPRDDKRLYGGDYPFVQTGDVRNCGGIIREYSQMYNEVGLRQSRLWPKGTLCITIAANIAETAILGIDACFPDSMVGFVADERISGAAYVHYWLSSVRSKIDAGASATAQKNINLAVLGDLAVPLSHPSEQHGVVAEIERRLSVADAEEKAIEAALKQAARLRQSILKRAFEGRLVPQDPTDEPADRLLERIRAEKAKHAAGQSRGRGRRTAKAGK